MRLWIILPLVAIFFAGCSQPDLDFSEVAEEVYTSPLHDGLRLLLWSKQADTIALHAQVVNHEVPLELDVACDAPWRSELLDPEGNVVFNKKGPECHPQRTRLLVGGTIGDVVHWDKTLADGTPAPPGMYTWNVWFLVDGVVFVNGPLHFEIPVPGWHVDAEMTPKDGGLLLAAWAHHTDAGVIQLECGSHWRAVLQGPGLVSDGTGAACPPGQVVHINETMVTRVLAPGDLVPGDYVWNVTLLSTPPVATELRFSWPQ